MKIYTSYYGNAKKLKAAGIKIVSISLYNPRFCSVDMNIKGLAPKADYKDDPEEKYTPKYLKQLKNDTPEDIIKTIKEASEKLLGGADVALCCYEKPGDFCHRHLLADYLNNAIKNKADKIYEFGFSAQQRFDISPDLFATLQDI